MTWLIILTWFIAFIMCGLGIRLLIQTGKTDFEPWERAKKNLIIAAILVTTPVNVWAFHFQPLVLSLLLSLLVNCLAILNFVLVVPEQWRRIVFRKKDARKKKRFPVE